MSMTKAVEGVFAIDKPKSITSAQVIRNLQHVFNPSRLFAPWLASEQANRDQENRRQRFRRKDKRLQVKVGHGGTLDPLATGVLIIGVGTGTKELPGFLACTKSYEATLLFGAATDTYDILGEVVDRAPYADVTQMGVAQGLKSFRGKIMQRPPIFSALRVQGKRLYEYAREGKEPPAEIQERPVEVIELEIVEWLEPGSHEYRIPTGQVSLDVTESILGLDRTTSLPSQDLVSHRGMKRKRPAISEEKDDDVLDGGVALGHPEGAGLPLVSEALTSSELGIASGSYKKCEGSIINVTALSSKPEIDRGPPAVRLRMTVTSGFYVRSLCHDLGKLVGSLGLMADLVRTRQGNFELGRNVLHYGEIAKAEDVWSPQIEGMLNEWQKLPAQKSASLETSSSHK